jgi:hypothetical protein
MKPQPSLPRPHFEIEIVRLIWLAIFVSVFSFLFFNRQGAVLLYGDAVAHINIARRVFDSKTPGLLQLGTVWLPLPHLLILPFIISNKMWQSGAGGSIPSMAAYVLGVLGTFRLMRRMLTSGGAPDATAKIAAWAAAILYGANPNLIYMQTTAMGESLYLALFLWALKYFAEFAGADTKRNHSLTKCGLCLAAACWTRYDGWFLATVLAIAAVVVEFRRNFKTNNSKTSDLKNDDLSKDKGPKLSASSRRMALVTFLLLAGAAPALWLAYNAAIYRNPLEFANGPYSAKAIEQKSATVNPAKGNMVAAGSYFLQAAELNVGESKWQGRLWLALALVGSLSVLLRGRGRLALLLWSPLPFYALSVAYGSVPIFVPTWWPFSYYNVRYGLQMLPAFSIFVPVGTLFIVQSVSAMPSVTVSWRRRFGAAIVLSALVLAAVSYSAIWRADPICYREASINSRSRVALDGQIANWVKSLPGNSTLLMYLGEHVGALEQAGIPLRRVINEGNHRVWRQPADPEGLWERALARPSQYADFLVGFEGDPVWKAANDQHLAALVEIHTTGQPRAAVFQARTQPR